MLLKLGVNIALLNPHLRSQFDVIDHVFLKQVGREGIITSGNDGQHMNGSLHYKWRAIDLRTRDIPKQNQIVVRDELDKALNRSGHLFDVILEPTHIHIEYDPK